MERTDGQILAAEPASVTFGTGTDERLFTIRPQKRARSRRFRKGVGEIMSHLQSLAAVVQVAVSADGRVTPAQIAQEVGGVLGEKLDEALDLIFVYDPTLDKDSEWIEENGTDDQFVDALVVCVELAFGPFVHRLKTKLANLQLMREASDGSLPFTSGSSSSGDSPSTTSSADGPTNNSD